MLAAIYDGPMDRHDYAFQPIILQNIPSQAEGQARSVQVPVEEGDWVINALGEKIRLAEGSQVYPSKCIEESCIVTYKKDMDLQMEQMIVNFSFLPNLRWADGEDLTAEDSVYAYILAGESKNPASEFLLSRTESYESVDDLTTVWRGLPGYRDNNYMENFWQPLPFHDWGEFSADELVSSDVSTRFPLGWGAFIVDEWLSGESITLIKNPVYHRADEGLPVVDELNFFFIPDPNEAVVALLEGRCDLLDPSIPLDNHVAFLQELALAGQISFYSTEKIALENLYFGIKPASYDDGIVSGNDRPRFFNDSRTRQAIAQCLDRQKVVDVVLHGLASVPDSYIPNTHPLYSANLSLYSFSPNEGSSLLNQIGWKDLDNNPDTPRTAYNVDNVPVGTPLELDYITTTSIQRREASEILAASLRECGVGVNLHYLPPAEFYAPAPEGILFGRNFDLAQFAMGSESLIPRCDWFSTGAIPNSANDWVGANLSGFSDTVYDTACQNSLFSLPDSLSFGTNYQETLAIYAEELPAVPLYPYVRIAVSLPDLVGFSLAPSSTNPLWNIEEIYSSRKVQATATPFFEPMEEPAPEEPPASTMTLEGPPIGKTSTPQPTSDGPPIGKTNTPKPTSESPPGT